MEVITYFNSKSPISKYIFTKSPITNKTQVLLSEIVVLPKILKINKNHC